MKIGYFGDGIWAYNAFQKLFDHPEIAFAFVCGRYGSIDHILKSMAEKHGIPWLQTENINSSEFIEKLVAFNCELFISMSFDQIFKPAVFNIPTMKTINCHAGKLPFYRGRNILNWALINDEKEFGITVHYIDEGIDTGDIICQKTYPITDKDSYATLLKTAHKECAEVLHSAVKLLAKGDAKPIPQETIHPVGTYFSKRTTGDEILNWNTKSREIFNFVRAICEPGPMARCWLGKQEVLINCADMVPDAPTYKCIPGAVLFEEEDAIFVKTLDSMIKVTDYRTSGRSFRPGDRLTSNVQSLEYGK